MKQFKIMVLFLGAVLLGCSDPNEEVFKNYETQKKEIRQLEEYFSSIMPEDLELYIRFESENAVNFELGQLNYDNKDSWNKSRIFDQYGQFQRFDVKLNSNELSEALELVKLTQDKLKKLRRYLDQANCVSIGNNSAFQSYANSAYISIGFPTDDLYGLEYNIFPRPRTGWEIDEIIKACNYKKIDNQVLVKYGGPAFGSDCFPDKR